MNREQLPEYKITFNLDEILFLHGAAITIAETYMADAPVNSDWKNSMDSASKKLAIMIKMKLNTVEELDLMQRITKEMVDNMSRKLADKLHHRRRN